MIVEIIVPEFFGKIRRTGPQDPEGFKFFKANAKQDESVQAFHKAVGDKQEPGSVVDLFQVLRIDLQVNAFFFQKAVYSCNGGFDG